MLRIEIFLLSFFCSYITSALICKRFERSQKAKEEETVHKTDADGWICADEQSPDCSDYYLTYLSDGRALGLNKDGAILYYKKEIDAWFYEDGYEGKGIEASAYVLAWQPLPDVYRGWTTHDSDV